MIINPADPVDQIFKPFEDALWQVLHNMQQFALNYIFGILALLFGIRCISGLMTGKFSILTCALTVIFGFLAITMGQAFWSDLPFVREFIH